MKTSDSTNLLHKGRKDAGDGVVDKEDRRSPGGNVQFLVRGRGNEENSGMLQMDERVDPKVVGFYPDMDVCLFFKDENVQ